MEPECCKILKILNTCEILGQQPGSQKLNENGKKYQLQGTTVYMQCIYSVGAVYTAVCSVSAVYPFPND